MSKGPIHAIRVNEKKDNEFGTEKIVGRHNTLKFLKFGSSHIFTILK